MSKQEKKMVVPELRFPEFKESRGWETLYGNTVFRQISNKEHNGDLPILAITQEHGAIPRELIDYNISVTDKSVKSYKIVEPGDFIISLRSFQGGIEYSSYKGICSPAYVILRKRIDLDETFFKHYFKTNAFIRNLTKNLEGIRDGKMVSYKQFSQVVLPIPKLNEQQKIADCLTSIDELVTSQIKKLDTLKAHKKGLLQQLFPSEGKTIPKLRYPEFQDTGDWEEIKLSSVVQLISGLHLSPNEYGESGNTPYFTGPSDFTNRESTISKWTNKSSSISKKEDILITVKGSGVGELWFLLLPSIAIGRQLMAIRTKNCISKFIFQLLSTQKRLFESLGAGNMIPGLSRADILGLVFRIPSTRKEQQKIADCLSSIDELIAAQSQEIEALKIHKKGLLQRLFPDMYGAEA